MSSRPFHALSGIEIKKIILTEIQRQLDADTRFNQNICYPLVSWRWKLAVNAHPMEPATFEVNVASTVKAPEVKIEEASQIPPEQIDIAGERTVAAPTDGETADAARRDANIPVPAPRFSPGPVEGSRVLVDAPEIPVDKKDEATAEPPRAKPSQSRVAAKVAELKTRAAGKNAVLATPKKGE